VCCYEHSIELSVACSCAHSVELSLAFCCEHELPGSLPFKQPGEYLNFSAWFIKSRVLFEQKKQNYEINNFRGK